MPKRSAEHIALHEAADHFEPRFRAQFVKTIKALQAKVSINDLAIRIMQQKRDPPPLVSRRAIAETIQPIGKVFQDSYRKGSKLGEERIKRKA